MLNECQRKIADTVDGVVVVDAGPGTGKTHTLVSRYMNILKKEVGTSDILTLTFTNNAADEMSERIKSEMIMEGRNAGDVRSSTFDSFCMNVVMESPETVSGFFKTKETLTRNAGLVQNDTLNTEYFKSVYTKFIRAHGRRYGNIPALIGTSYRDVYKVIQKLMSIGVAPTHDDGWFGFDKSVLRGSADELTAALKGNEKKIRDRLKDKDLPPGDDEISDAMIHDAVNDERKDLLFFINGVYYEFIRRSISDNRLTFGLNALFAFIILHENGHVRKMMSFRYVMIDEFQDTNELQFMISLLILKEPNLCVVGDWKQGIYGFRYASVENITEFEERMKKMRNFLNKGEKRVIPGIREPVSLPLTENYRSTQLVIDTSFASLRCRTKKDEVIDTEWLDANVTELKAIRDHEHTEVRGLRSESYDDEILTILQSIREYVTDPKYKVIKHDRDGNVSEERQPEYGDIAVLCRNSAMCIRIKEEAQRYGIPAHLQGDMEIMATREGKLVLAWLRYVNNRDDVRGPVAILADAGYDLAELRKMFREKNMTDKIPEGLKEQRDALVGKRRRINQLLTSIFEYHNLNNDVTGAIISTISSAHGDSMLTISDIIRLMESDIERSSRYDMDALLDGRSVMIQTMHKSKGLEYPIVILGGLTEGKFPFGRGDSEMIRFSPLFGIRMTKEYSVAGDHHRIYDSRNWAVAGSVSERDRNEERRLFFVALSRAKQYITMTCSRKPSYFMKDMCKDIREVSPSLQIVSSSDTVRSGERPVVPPYEKRKKRIPLHEIMGKYEESGGGKGTEHGIRVHKDAQRMVRGLRPSKEDDETAYIRTILDEMKDADDIRAEVDCSLPIKDMVITGRIDIIGIFDDRVEIRDIKTDMNRKNEDRYKIQLSVYAHAAETFGKKVVCFIDYVSQGISVPVEMITKDEIYEEAVSSGWSDE